MAKPTGNPNGRPPKWKIPEELEADVELYLDHVRANYDKTLANKTGFSLFIKCDRDTVNEYEKKDGFSVAIKKLIAFSEQQCVEKCYSSNTQIAGTVFLMKNLHKYTDKHEVDTNNKTEMTVNGESVNNLRLDDSSLDAVQRILDGLDKGE